MKYIFIIWLCILFTGCTSNMTKDKGQDRSRINGEQTRIEFLSWSTKEIKITSWIDTNF